jgi:hypothetical protein
MKTPRYIKIFLFILVNLLPFYAAIACYTIRPIVIQQLLWQVVIRVGECSYIEASDDYAMANIYHHIVADCDIDQSLSYNDED